jgi:putative sigma-54 modulation protein
MQFSVTFRHMEATEALKGYARERLDRIRKYFPDPMSIHVVLSTERYNHRVDVNLKLHNGFKIAAQETTEDMYSSIDMVAAKIERQVRRYKDKLREHKAREMGPLAVLHSVISEQPLISTRPDEVEPGAAAEPDDAPEPTPSAEHLIIKRENVTAEPMSVSEAIMQLNLLHENFHIFRNEVSGQVSVVYRREDGAYGLIETTRPD